MERTEAFEQGWYSQRIDRDDGEIRYEAHGPKESFVRFEGPNAKHDCDRFMDAVKPPAQQPAPVKQPEWECAARATSFDPPQDCDWPVCGCDPAAVKVIEALEEGGMTLVNPDRMNDILAPQAQQPAQGAEVERVKRAFISAYCELPEKHIDAETMERFMRVSDRVSRSLQAALDTIQPAAKEA